MPREYLPIIDYYSLESPIATELRRLLHNLRRHQREAELKSVLLTSATTGEGKSTISALLAITAAKKGMKTLLVDCDLRRPTVHRLFAVDRRHGMVEVLSEGVPPKAVVKRTALENLDLITAGQAVPHPTELFDSRAIGSFIGELKFYYDLVVIDTPPVIPVSDPMMLAQELDAALLVVKAGATAREVVARAADIMTSNSNNLLGVVLNNVKGSLPYYYDYSHYHYDYSPRVPNKKNGRTNGKRKGKQTSADKKSTDDKKSGSGGTTATQSQGEKASSAAGSRGSGKKQIPR
jgi:capsular exopolysaccharide synthesis family protein